MAETGLNYNYFRDYDPQVGGYIESDPRGLRGISYSTYAYVRGNPIGLRDPLGLCPNVCAPAGNAMSPGQFAASGFATGIEMNLPFGIIPALANMLQFGRGGALDAQAAGASTPYANYVYGVYFAAAGMSLGETLQNANTYGYLFSQYSPNQLSNADANYPSIPLSNVTNVAQGYMDFINGTLCTLQ